MYECMGPNSIKLLLKNAVAPWSAEIEEEKGIEKANSEYNKLRDERPNQLSKDERQKTKLWQRKGKKNEKKVTKQDRTTTPESDRKSWGQAGTVCLPRGATRRREVARAIRWQNISCRDVA